MDREAVHKGWSDEPGNQAECALNGDRDKSQINQRQTLLTRPMFKNDSEYISCIDRVRKLARKNYRLACNFIINMKSELCV